jgi:hypothetical protein
MSFLSTAPRLLILLPPRLLLLMIFWGDAASVAFSKQIRNEISKEACSTPAPGTYTLDSDFGRARPTSARSSNRVAPSFSFGSLSNNEPGEKNAHRPDIPGPGDWYTFFTPTKAANS